MAGDDGLARNVLVRSSLVREASFQQFFGEVVRLSLPSLVRGARPDHPSLSPLARQGTFRLPGAGAQLSLQPLPSVSTRTRRDEPSGLSRRAAPAENAASERAVAEIIVGGARTAPCHHHDLRPAWKISGFRHVRANRVRLDSRPAPARRLWHEDPFIGAPSLFRPMFTARRPDHVREEPKKSGQDEPRQRGAPHYGWARFSSCATTLPYGLPTESTSRPPSLARGLSRLAQWPPRQP